MAKKEKDQIEINFESSNFVDITELPNILQKSVLPVILIVKNRIIPLGTAFCISSAGLLLTARHVIEDIYHDFAEDNIVTKCELYVIYVSENNIGGFLPVNRITFSKDSDLAILSISFPWIDDKPLFMPAFRLSPGLPSLNQYTMALGYSKMKGEIKNVEEVVAYAQNFNAAKGDIEEIHGYKRDGIMLNFPCFRTNARYDSGMSGGPILSESGNVIGVISSSFSVDNGSDPYTSYGVLLPPLFALPALVIVDKEIGPKEYSLYDLAKDGHISVDNTFSNIELSVTDGETHLSYR